MARFLILAFAAVALFGCATSGGAPAATDGEPFSFKTATLWEQDEELDGYVQPSACHRDLSFVSEPVFYVTSRRMTTIYATAGVRIRNATGAYFRAREAAIIGIQPGIYINEDADSRIQDIALHHERCHVVVPEWTHEDWVPKKR